MRVTPAVELVAALALSVGLTCGAATAAAPIEGAWLTEDRGGVIDIEPCGSLYCGRIVGLAAASSGQPVPNDVHGNSRCGLQIIQGLVESDPGEWTGKITNPEDGQTYSARLSVDDRGRLRLRGYVVVPLLGRTQTWTRYGGRVTAKCRMLPANRPQILSNRTGLPSAPPAYGGSILLAPAMASLLSPPISDRDFPVESRTLAGQVRCIWTMEEWERTEALIRRNRALLARAAAARAAASEAVATAEHALRIVEQNKVERARRNADRRRLVGSTLLTRPATSAEPPRWSPR
jgi:uncharacterized protein (DUF2147 family)